MPHAALFVVQEIFYLLFICKLIVSMPHAALFVVQEPEPQNTQQETYRFNAARGFVCGASFPTTIEARSMNLFQCRTRLCLWCKDIPYLVCKPVNGSFNAARGFVCGARGIPPRGYTSVLCFNAARGFVCGASPIQCRTPQQARKFQCRTRLCLWCKGCMAHVNGMGRLVSMPHAALFVVQEQ